MDELALNTIKSVYFFPCSLTEGDAYLAIQFTTPPKADNKTVYFFRKSWLNNTSSSDDDDAKMVKSLNQSFRDLWKYSNAPQLVEFESTQGFEGRVEKTFELSMVFANEKVIIGPQSKLFYSMETVDAIFLERMASYTRSFDLTIVSGEKTLSVSTIQRKKHLRVVQELFNDKGCFETGPDPLPWSNMFIRKNQDNLTWRDMYHLLNEANAEGSEEECSEWSEGRTDDSEEDDFSYDDDFDEDELKEGVYEEVSSSESSADDMNADWDKEFKKRPLEVTDGEEASAKKVKV